MKDQDEGKRISISDTTKIIQFVFIEEEACYMLDELHNGICGPTSDGEPLKPEPCELPIINQLWKHIARPLLRSVKRVKNMTIMLNCLIINA